MEGTGLQGLTSQVMAKGAIDPQTLPCPEPRLPSFPWHLPAHTGPQHCRVRRTTQESQGPRSRDLPRPTASLRQAHVLMVKNPPASAGDVRDTGSIPGSGRSPGGGRSNPLQYSCLENSTDRGAWRATVHRVAKSRTPLK